VLACFRLAADARGLCLSHQGRWKAAHRAPGFDFARWCLTDDGVARSGLVNLRAIPPLVRAQMMAAVQRIAVGGRKVDPDLWRVVVRHVRHRLTATLHAVDASGMPPQPAKLLRDLQRESRRAATTWDEEQQADVWDLGVAGLVGTIDFTPVTQPWLRASTKWWISGDLPRRRGTKTHQALRGIVNSMTELSASLRLHRADNGNSPHLLGRSDILAFLTRLVHLRQKGTVTPACHVRTLREVKTILAACRDVGLAKPGGPMHGLPGEFAIRSADLPPDPDQHSWRPLPAEVIRALDAELPRLEQRSQREFRTAVELLMDTGRRPNEICQLPLQCLDRDTDGRDVLIYTDFKANRLDRRLPIAASTAQLIRDQQRRVRERFPSMPDKGLALLPAKSRNPHGGKPINATTLSEVHRTWIDSLPPPTLLDGTAFPRQYLVLYAYRHSYAQRHADAGTPMDVLRDLMGHRSTATTQIYYRNSRELHQVGEKSLVARSGRRLLGLSKVCGVAV
jgi:integrase